jgi:hypothetical protein
MRRPQLPKLASASVMAAETHSSQSDPGRSNAVHDAASALTFRGSPSGQSSTKLPLRLSRPSKCFRHESPDRVPHLLQWRFKLDQELALRGSAGRNRSDGCGSPSSVVDLGRVCDLRRLVVAVFFMPVFPHQPQQPPVAQRASVSIYQPVGELARTRW